MNRDEFMELVYETFADEPDNVLANGIIEAADAYVEHEKTQTVERLRGVVEITVPITDYDGGYIDGIETGISIVSTMSPAEPKTGRWIYCEDTTADCVDGYRCDQCGLFVPWDYQHKSIDYIKDYNFCPNCGAKMEE